MASSETLVTASMIPPASFINLTTCASSCATMSFLLTRPAVFLSPWKMLDIRMSDVHIRNQWKKWEPLTANVSFVVKGTPKNGVSSNKVAASICLLWINLSTFLASIKASSNRWSTMQLIRGLTSLIRSMYAWTTSSLESWKSIESWKQVLRGNCKLIWWCLHLHFGFWS